MCVCVYIKIFSGKSAILPIAMALFVTLCVSVYLIFVKIRPVRTRMTHRHTDTEKVKAMAVSKIPDLPRNVKINDYEV